MSVRILHAPVPAFEAKPPVKRRKPQDYSKLVLRNGRLTRAYWILREAFTQDFRRTYYSGTKSRGITYDRIEGSHVMALIRKGYLKHHEGPRGGSVYRTTPDGAFAMLIAEGQHEAKKEEATCQKSTSSAPSAAAKM